MTLSCGPKANQPSQQQNGCIGTSQPSHAPDHPLDPLSASEIALAADLCREHAKSTEIMLRFNAISLKVQGAGHLPGGHWVRSPSVACTSAGQGRPVVLDSNTIPLINGRDKLMSWYSSLLATLQWRTRHCTRHRTRHLAGTRERCAACLPKVATGHHPQTAPPGLLHCAQPPFAHPVRGGGRAGVGRMGWARGVVTRGELGGHRGRKAHDQP
jgi:hypothetical protein